VLLRRAQTPRDHERVMMITRQWDQCRVARHGMDGVTGPTACGALSQKPD
jgi:hypothetical protein